MKRSRATMPTSAAAGKRLTLPQARANRAKLDLARLRAAGAELLRHAHLRPITIWPSWRNTSTGRPSSRPGNWPGRIPPSSTTTRSARRRAICIADAQAMLKKIVDGEMADGPRRDRLLAGQPHRTTTISSSMATRRGNFPFTTLHTLRQQMAREQDRPNLALADFIAPEGTADYHRRLCGHRRHRRGKAHQDVRGRQGRLFRHPAARAGRPPGRSLCRAHA